MKKSSKGEAVLSACQIQAIRLNQLEYRRFQRNVDIMQDDLKIHLARLQRQAQGVIYHYTNVIRVVKPNPTYQLWKQTHAYDIAEDETKTCLESVRLAQKSASKTHQQISSSNEVPSEPDLPLLLLVGNDIEKSVEPMIDFSETFLRPKTSPVNKHLPEQHRQNALLTLLNKHSINSNNSVSVLPSITPAGSRKLEQGKFISPTQKTANLDALYRIALQNQTAYKSIEQTHVEKRKLLDKEFASQHRALKGTVRSAGLVK